MKPNNRKKKVTSSLTNERETLLIDGNYLLKRVYHSFEKDNTDILYNFLILIRSLIKQYNFNKCVVFWDGTDGGILRQRIYEDYKGNRDTKAWYKGELSLYERDKIKSRKKALSYHKMNIQNSLQHLYIRQIEYKEHEADDLICEYCEKYNKKENITLFTNDRDLLQILNFSDNIKVILGNIYINSLDKGRIYVPITRENIVEHLKVRHENISVTKIFCGDASDNIKGVKGFGEKTLEKYIDYKNKVYTKEEVLEILEEEYVKKPNQALFCAMMGFTNDIYTNLDKDFDIIVTDNGVRIGFNGSFEEYEINEKLINRIKGLKFTDILKKLKYDYIKYDFLKKACELFKRKSCYRDIYEINEEIIDLVNFRKITDEAKEELEFKSESILDEESRGSKYLIPIMGETNFFESYNKFYPTNNKINKKNLIDFCTPFIRLVKSEQEYSKQDI